jgi:hypothetical protein
MRLLAIIPILLFPLAVRAEPERTPDAAKMHGDDCAQARNQHKTCVLDMGKGEQVDGSTATPRGVSIGVLGTTKQPSLVQVRRDFIVEILRTAEDL